jgi:superfamily II DNA or RNA helicase/HKD family nuclease
MSSETRNHCDQLESILAAIDNSIAADSDGDLLSGALAEGIDPQTAAEQVRTTLLHAAETYLVATSPETASSHHNVSQLPAFSEGDVVQRLSQPDAAGVVRKVRWHTHNENWEYSIQFGGEVHEVAESAIQKFRQVQSGCDSLSGSAPQRHTLWSLPNIRPMYILPTDPLADEVLIPAFRVAAEVDCMVGFFSGSVLASLAPGLATYITTSSSNFRLIISPFVRADDQAAIEEGLKSVEDVAQEALEAIVITEDLLQRHTLKCLSWLLRFGRIEIKVAFMKGALFHPKVWLFRHGADVMAVHGSSNVTYAGIKMNIEQVAVSKSWEDPNQRYITDKLNYQFEQLWKRRDDSCVIVDMPRAVRERLLQTYRSNTPPTEAELHILYYQATGITEETPEPSELPAVARSTFTIPAGIRFEDGPFEHQGKAVKRWCEAGFRGVLEMATGSGKTITAMICANRLYAVHKPLLIVVAAPYLPLIQQWCDEIAPFRLRPVNLTVAPGARGRAHELNRIKRRFRIGTTDVEAVVVSHRTLCDTAFKAEIQKFDCATLLIADEVHNLGSERFVTDPPSFFDYRLGLSATPVRQYDDEGTEALFSFFGPVVFRFTLREAIGRCLVEYDYYIDPVQLTQYEMDEWYELTAKIKANAWRQEDGKPDEYLTKLFRDRRVLLETAENKIAALEAALEREDLRALRHTLIYASDKAPQQLEAVNALLKTHGVLFHQLTYEETANRDETERIIRSFQEGTLSVLTAKRVLDEGVNIPQIEKAFILASTTVERQWVQRRGRLLRTCREIGKTHSEIHDFVALPPDMNNIDDEARKLIQSELLRVQEFASLARNAGRSDGPLSVIRELVNAVFM